MAGELLTRRRRRSGGRRQRRWWWVAVGAVMLVLIAAGLTVARVLIPSVAILDHPVPRAPGEQVSIPPLTSKERINLLLLGADDDRKFAPSERLTQTMIVLGIDPERRRVVVFSIPRDLWVNIPGKSTAKIDFAYRFGGVKLARQTVQELFGIPVHFYAYVGLGGLVKAVDSVGGVDVDILHPVVDELYPDDLGPGSPFAGMRLYLPPGPQHLDGRRALEYVRSRHGDQIGDIGRNVRQQQVLLALKQRLGGDLVGQVPALLQDLQGYVESDLGPVRAAQLALFARDLKPDAIEQLVLFDPEFVESAKSSDGQEILLPHWPQIRAEVQRAFGTGR
jgi:LCP family protein required for cell wall assembly